MAGLQRHRRLWQRRQILSQSLENETGFDAPPANPAPFFTRPYSFAHGPAKHAGARYSFKLPTEEGGPLRGAEVGIVRGWNNWDDENNDPDVIFNLRWRSADMATWIDWENIYGNGADDSDPVTETGSPYPRGWLGSAR